MTYVILDPLMQPLIRPIQGIRWVNVDSWDRIAQHFHVLQRVSSRSDVHQTWVDAGYYYSLARPTFSWIEDVLQEPREKALPDWYTRELLVTTQQEYFVCFCSLTDAIAECGETGVDLDRLTHAILSMLHDIASAF
jgi:hypothetical protein